MVLHPYALRVLWVALLASVFAGCQRSGSDGSEPRQRAGAAGQAGAKDEAATFARSVIALGEQGEFAALMRLSTPSLQALSAKAVEASRQFAHAHPGEKPPLGDGEMVALFGMVDATTLDGVMVRSIDRQQARVDVSLAYVGETPGRVATVQLVLRREPGGEWRLDNVVYDQGGNARDTLESVISP